MAKAKTLKKIKVLLDPERESALLDFCQRMEPILISHIKLSSGDQRTFAAETLGKLRKCLSKGE